MSYFQNLNSNDRVTFEGCEVSNIEVVIDKHSKDITHYRLSIPAPESGTVDIRLFTPAEIRHLKEAEIMDVERGYYTPARVRDRDLYGSREVNGSSSAQRERIDLAMQQCRLMERYYALGMTLTKEGVAQYRDEMVRDYETYQARKKYGTQKANAAQLLKRLPSNSNLLEKFLKYRRAKGNPRAFLPVKSDPIDLDLQVSEDFCFVMERLGRYASADGISKSEVIDDLIGDMKSENVYRESIGKPKMKILSQRQYERWIDKYLDPFEVTMQRESLAAAMRKFGSVEPGRKATYIGEVVTFDAWQAHMKVRNCTRDEYNMMTEERRKAVKLVSPWITAAEDLATRAIVGVSFSLTPNQEASLECLRMIYRDKTHLFRNAGIKGSDYNMICYMREASNDNGSEYGKDPFGGALFSSAVRLLGSTQMNGAAGVSKLRGAMERFFWTCDLKWARFLPGYTAENPQARNDRKYLSEACICWDEFQTLFLLFIAEYHKTPHRGLKGRTPAAVWQELSDNSEYDPSQMPSPSQFREACGFHSTATVSEEGIKYAGIVYSNQFIRQQRMGRMVDRIAAPGERIEIMVDPHDVGAISVLANGDLITVSAITEGVYGKSLREWQAERQIERMKRDAENLEQDEARREARALCKSLSQSIMLASDIGMFGYTKAEIDRAKKEAEYGHGQFEKPFVGRDEYVDPLTEGGYRTAEPEDDEDFAEPDTVDNEAKTDMDRLRSASRNRKSKRK